MSTAAAPSPPQPGAHAGTVHGDDHLDRQDGDRQHRKWLMAATAAGLLVLLALLAAFALGSGWHWAWWTVAGLALAAALYFVLKRTGSQVLRSGLLIASAICSLIVLYIWAVERESATASNADTPVTVTAPTGPATPPADTVVPAPDPTQPLLDENVNTNDAVPGSSYLVAMRKAAADLQLPPGDDDFRPPYAESELRRLAEWELAYLRGNSSDPKFTDLGRHIGMPGTPDGGALADYLHANARLLPVGADGLHVNHYTYNKSGEVVWCHEVTLPSDTLVWYRNGTNEPLIQWNGLNWIVPVR